MKLIGTNIFDAWNLNNCSSCYPKESETLEDREHAGKISSEAEQATYGDGEMGKDLIYIIDLFG
jgi:hypothetical protein